MEYTQKQESLTHTPRACHSSSDTQTLEQFWETTKKQEFIPDRLLEILENDKITKQERRLILPNSPGIKWNLYTKYLNTMWAA